MFSLMKGDSVLLEKLGPSAVCNVTKFSQTETGHVAIKLIPHSLTLRAADERRLSLLRGPNPLRELGARKVLVDTLGRILPTND
jgi:hypothetical protein